jgi:thioredoxin-dependent peroxiredoxin
MLNPGDKAPDFALPDDNGQTVSLSKLKGRPVVVYFYPKDDTSGCTKEAEGFSAAAAAFAEAGCVVIGVSKDSVAKHDLAVTLAADEDKAVATAYGVWVEKSMYGRKYMGVERSTFLVDKKGKIVQLWRKVKIPGHVEEVLGAVKALNL